MKNRNVIILLGTLIVSFALFLLYVSMKQKDRLAIKIAAEDVHKMLSNGDHFIFPADIEELRHTMSEGFVFIDLRTPEEYEKYHPEETINIPFQQILEEDYAKLLSDGRKKILYASSEAKATEVWILLRQTGVTNVFVLKGGLPYWMEKMEKRNIFGKSSVNEEKARYDFKKELAAKDTAQ